MLYMYTYYIIFADARLQIYRGHAIKYKILSKKSLWNYK